MISIDVFEQIKDVVDVADVATRYGITTTHHGKALCPFHNDTHPSLSFKNGRYKCFACDAAGDAVDFVSHLQGLSLIDAAREIDTIYKLNLFPDKPLSNSERKATQEAIQQHKWNRKRLSDFGKWENWACNIVAVYLCKLDEWKSIHAPKTPDDEWHPLFTESCNNLDLWDYMYTSVFIEGDFEVKVNFYKHYSKKVIELAERFNTSTETIIA